MKLVTAAATTALLIGASVASAQPSDRSTYVTFSGPVSIPGKTLPAGTYTFKLADSPSDRHIVQVYDKDQTQVFATLLAVPAERAEASGDPVITFGETPSNTPPAVRYWYYAGEKSGTEFVYPKSQARMIARASGQPVLAMETDVSDVSQWKGTPERVTANAEPQASTTASTTSTTASSTTTAQPTTTPATEPTQPAPATQPTTTQPTATPAEPAQPMTSQPTTTPTTTAPERPAATTAAQDRPAGTSGRSEPSELPRTAGELPTVGLIALLAFAGAFALRAARATS
jgi:hypothetical protein